MIRLSLTGLLAAFFVATAACAGEITVQTARGEVALTARPETVAVYDVAAIDTLAALGVTPAGTPDRLYVPHLAEVPLNPVGTLFEPDLEALVALDPDLVITGGRSSTKVEALSRVAPTLDMTIGEDVPAEARARIAAYGALFGKEARAAEMEHALDAAIAAARAAVTGKGRALILQTNGPKISAYGRASRFGWIHGALGLPEAHAALSPDTHGDAVSFEFVAETNPDWLIVVDRAAAIGETASAHATLDNPLVAGTTAGQKGQIVYLSPAPIYIAGGGYRSILITLDEITAAFSE